MRGLVRFGMGALATVIVQGQDPAALLESSAARQALGAQGTAAPTMELPSRNQATAFPAPSADEQTTRRLDQERLEKDIKAAKAKEGGRPRFAADLFETRQYGFGATDGGIAEDYVLGVGDRLQMNVFGSANLEYPLQVDGRGGVMIPKVGTVSVGGLSLAKARAAVQGKVGQLFSRSTVDLSVTKLREVRVFVLGEVYKPGSFLVPNLTSIVNVLGLSGGPTAIGSFREVRVIRGGRVVHTVDLYPLRAEGLGNLNFGFQNGDTVFIPLVQNLVQLEGGFTRVVASVPSPASKDAPRDGKPDSPEQRRLKQEIKRLDARLGPTAKEEPSEPGLQEGFDKGQEGQVKAPKEAGSAQDGSAALTPAERVELENRRELLKATLRESQLKGRGDLRIEPEADGFPASGSELDSQPAWLSQWLTGGKAPVMSFEMLPGETVKDALRFAGGFALQAFSGSLTLRRTTASGALEVTDVPAGEAMAKATLTRGDILTALPLRDFPGGAVTVGGWARVQGLFAREGDQKLGAFLKRHAILLPDTYLERGELVRTLPDYSKRYLAFNVSKALAGEEGHDLPLENRDAIELYRVGDLRLRRTLTVVGPVSRQGTFEFIEGMRASDLLFRAGVPLVNANRFVAELAHSREGKLSEVRALDLAKLLSTEKGSPVDLKDEALNPLLEPFDQLSIFTKPDFRQHRTVILSGQVVRPGAYELDSSTTSLKEILARAGGLTPEAMPAAGVFLRTLDKGNSEKSRASALTGLEPADPTSNGINEVLKRLNETKRVNAPNSAQNGNIQVSPLLHGLQTGSLNRLVVNIPALLAGDPKAQVDLQDGDEIIIPRKTDVAYVVGEAASPFAAFKVYPGMTVKQILALAGGPTRNADTWNMRLLKADGRILDSWLNGKAVEPGDALLVPQRIMRDVSWQENLAALTPLAIMINAVRR